MKSIILAAGFSTRLYPLTKDFPKGLLPLGGKTIASYVADDIMKTKGITRTALVTNSCFAGRFRAWSKQFYQGRLSVLDNGVKCLEDKLGAIGDLLFTLDQTGWDDDILVATSDTLASLSVANLLSFYRNHGGVTTAVFKTDDPDKIAGKLGCAVLDGDKIASFVEKPEVPPSLFMAVPFYIFPRACLPLIRAYRDEGNKLDAPGSIISWLLGKGPVYAYEVKGYYYDVGTVASYKYLKTAFQPQLS